MNIDAILILGKSCPEDPPRGDRELAARAAAASAALRAGAEWAATLEAQLRGQDRAGSQIVLGFLEQLDAPRERVVVDERTHTTREEAVAGAELAARRGARRLGVLTGAYHVERARRYFAREMPSNRFVVITPEHFLQRATSREREWILAGSNTPEELELERRREGLYRAVFGPMAWLPGGARLEMAIGTAWRRVG